MLLTAKPVVFMKDR